MESKKPQLDAAVRMQRRTPSCLACLLAALAATAAGCGGHDATLLGDYLDELEFDAPLASVAYVPLGKFDVPVPAHAKARGA